MQTPIEKLFDYLRAMYPQAMPHTAEQERLLVDEKIHLQEAYNAGFSYAKKMYESNT
jgi:hypothetical protein